MKTPRELLVATLNNWIRLGLWSAVVLGLVGIASSPSRADDCEFGEGVKYQGVEQCVTCHSSGDTVVSTLRRSFCRLNEAAESRNKDRHSLAYRILVESDITRRMEEKLRVEAGSLAKSEACLACHAGWNADWGPADKRKTWLADGVSCEACHGPSTEYFAPHQKSDWRLLSSCDKTKQGLIDLRDPVRKAEVCLSCHVGNHAEGRFVTHAMYAAGHPPLPSFELATYLEQMPPHWRKLQEKGQLFRNATDAAPALVTTREDYLKANPLVAYESDTRDLRVGGLMTLRAALLLAAGPPAQPGATPQLADFAQFDCQSCHHDLADPGFRQTRYLLDVRAKHPGRATFGRLRPFEWAERLARVAVADSDRGEFVQAELNRVRLAFAVDPLGRQQVLQPLLSTPHEGISAKLREWATELATQPVSAEALDAMTARIFEEAAGPLVDYHSARQLTWALQVIGVERLLAGKHPDGLSTPEQVPNETAESSDLKKLEIADLAAFDRFRQTVKEAEWTRVRAAFGGVEPNVARRMSALRITDVPPDSRTVEDARDDKKLRSILADAYEADQTEILRSAATYDPRKFAEWLKSVQTKP